MERLTVKRSDGRWALANNDGAKPLKQMEKIPIAIDRLAAYEDAMPLERAQELAQAEKDGRLLVLQKAPPQIGNTVYEIVENAILENLVTYVDLQRMSCEASSDKGGLVEFYLCEIGKTVFLTREEAEAALKKRKADNEVY